MNLPSCRRFGAALFALLSLAGVAGADDRPPEGAAARPRVALVLSGGGARGLAHIGAIRELERRRIPVDCIAGTSMGGIVGGVYASGMPIDEIERTARVIDWSLAFQERPDRSAMRAWRKRDENGQFARPEFGFRNGAVVTPAGVIYGQNLSEIFNRLANRAIGVGHFDQLPIPYRAVATDIATGHAVVLDRGSLPLALRATMSVPGAMAPVSIDGQLLIDGGLVDNLPVATARATCGDVVIAVNLGTPLLDRKDIGSAVSVGFQMVNILTEQNVRAALASMRPDDVLISPKLDGLNFASFDHVDEFIAAGAAAVREAAAQLDRLAAPPQEFARWKAGRDRPDASGIGFDEVRIGRTNWVNPDILRADLQSVRNDPTASSLIRGGRRIFERGDFERVQISFAEEQGRRIALLDATEKSWGPDYLRFGLSMTAQTGESTAFNAVIGYTRTWVNAYGARWQSVLQVGEKGALHSEFHQPVMPASPVFIAPRVLGTMEQSPLYLGDSQQARVTRSQALVALEAGSEFGRSGEMRLGMLAGRENYHVDVGPVSDATGWTPIRAITARIDIDALDKAQFPTRGHRVVLDIHDATGATEARNRFRRQALEASKVVTWKQNTFSLHLMAGQVDRTTSVADIAFDLIPLGGFQRLSAYPAGRFRVDRVDFARLGYQRNIAPLLGLNLGGIVSQTYFGGTVETARIEQSVDPQTRNGAYQSSSVFIGADTILGPAAFSFGFGAAGQRTVWLSIGIPWTLH